MTMNDTNNGTSSSTSNSRTTSTTTTTTTTRTTTPTTNKTLKTKRSPLPSPSSTNTNTINTINSSPTRINRQKQQQQQKQQQPKVRSQLVKSNSLSSSTSRRQLESTSNNNTTSTNNKNNNNKDIKTQQNRPRNSSNSNSNSNSNSKPTTRSDSSENNSNQRGGVGRKQRNTKKEGGRDEGQQSKRQDSNNNNNNNNNTSSTSTSSSSSRSRLSVNTDTTKSSSSTNTNDRKNQQRIDKNNSRQSLRQPSRNNNNNNNNNNNIIIKDNSLSTLKSVPVNDPNPSTLHLLGPNAAATPVAALADRTSPVAAVSSTTTPRIKIKNRTNNKKKKSIPNNTQTGTIQGTEDSSYSYQQHQDKNTNNNNTNIISRQAVKEGEESHQSLSKFIMVVDRQESSVSSDLSANSSSVRSSSSFSPSIPRGNTSTAAAAAAAAINNNDSQRQRQRSRRSQQDNNNTPVSTQKQPQQQQQNGNNNNHNSIRSKQENSKRQERSRSTILLAPKQNHGGKDYSIPLKGEGQDGSNNNNNNSDDHNETEEEVERRRKIEYSSARTNRTAASSSSSDASSISMGNSSSDDDDDGNDNPQTQSKSKPNLNLSMSLMSLQSEKSSRTTSSRVDRLQQQQQPRGRSVTIQEGESHKTSKPPSVLSTVSSDQNKNVNKNNPNLERLLSSVDQVKILDIGFQKNKLRGRDFETQQLRQAIERTYLPDGHVEVVLVMGPSGSGKTRLVQEALGDSSNSNSNSNSKNGSCFILQGKFDPNHTNIYRPYSAFLEVFAQLSKQVQKHPNYKNFYQTNIRAALGKEAFRITSLIPEFARILEVSGGNEDVGGEDTNFGWRDRQLKDQSSLFQIFRLLRGMIRQICTPDDPVVIFLDDLNNGGSESLELFQYLFQDESMKNFLLIGTFEDEKHKPQGVDMLRASTIIRLGNLDADATNAFVSDALGLNIHDRTIRKISEFFRKKTGGNCLFLTHYLYRLQQLEMMTYSQKTKSWAWTKKDKIQKEKVDLQHVLKSRLQNLPKTAQVVLTYAAMLGNTFPVDYLAKLLEVDPRISMKSICKQDIDRNKFFLFENAIGMVEHEESWKEGAYKPSRLTPNVYTIVQALTKLMILVPHPSFKMEYQFAHDQFHRAALALVKERKKLHWRIGKLLEKMMEKNQEEGRAEANWLFYTVAEQLNMGFDDQESEEDRVKLASLTFQCGKFMRDESAFYPAAAYSKEGLTLMMKIKDRWEKYRELMTKLVLLRAETVMCCGRTEDVMEVTQEILDNSRSWEDIVPAFFLRIRAFGQVAQFAEAVHMGLAALMHLGEEFPHNGDISALKPELEENLRRGFGKDEEDFENLTLMVDKKHLIIMEVLSSAVFYAIRGTINTQKLVPFFFYRMYEITLEYGYCWDSIPAFAGYGILMAGAMNDYEEGHRFYKLAMMLQKGIGPSYNARSSHMAYGFLHHLKEPLSDTLGPLMSGYIDGMAVDETADAVNCLSVWCSHYLNIGMPLLPLIDQMRDYLKIMTELKRERIWRATAPYVQLASNLAGQNSEARLSDLSGEFMDWSEMCERLEISNNINAVRAMHAAGLEAAYWFGEYVRAGEMLEKLIGMDIGVGQALTFHYRREVFFSGLVSVKLYRNSLTTSRSMYYLYKARDFAAQLRLCFERGSPDCEDYTLILEAEYRSISSMFSSYSKLAEGYLEAVDAAGRIGSLQNIALSNELAGRYISDNVDHVEGIKLLKQARQAYRDWNAVAKAEHLEQMYTELMEDEDGQEGT